MTRAFRRGLILACCMVLMGATPCVVPKRIHLSAIILDINDNPAPIAQRLKTQPWETVGKSLPKNFSPDAGWYEPAELAGSQYSAAVSLPAGGTAPLSGGFARGFVHVDEIRPQMSCDRAIAAYPHDSWARLIRASSEVYAGRYPAAIADYQAAIGPDPKMTLAARYGLAQIYYRQRDYKKALENVDAAAASNTGDSYTLRALIEEAMGDDDLATADAAQGRNQYNGPGQDDSPALFALAAAYSDLGYFAASNEQLDTLLKRKRQPGTLALRAFNRFSSGDIAGARADFAAATKIAPPMQAAYLGSAMIDFALGNVRQARRETARALALFPKDGYVALWMRITDPSWKIPVSATRAWPAPVLAVFAGRAPVQSLAHAAASLDAFTGKMQRCEAHFYGGVYMLQHGNKAQGRAWIRTAAQTCPYREYERAAAMELLRHE